MRRTTMLREVFVRRFEEAFAQGDMAHATARAHLTTAAAGRVGRDASEPVHFSARYAGQDARMLAQVAVDVAGST
jgi:ribonuclease Z